MSLEIFTIIFLSNKSSFIRSILHRKLQLVFIFIRIVTYSERYFLMQTLLSAIGDVDIMRPFLSPELRRNLRSIAVKTTQRRYLLACMMMKVDFGYNFKVLCFVRFV